MASNLSKYIRAYSLFIKNSIAVESEYRASLIFKSLAGFCWMFGSLFFINVIFSQTSSVAGWTKLEVTLLYVCFSISMDLFDMILRNNFVRFSEHVRQGSLDWILLRPINTRILVSLMGDGLIITIAPRLLAGFGLLFYYLPKYTPVVNIISFFIFLIVGNFAVYSFVYCLNTLNIWFVRVNNITALIQNTFGFARLPLDSWPKIMQLFLIYVLPMGLLSTYAVRSLLGKTSSLDLLTAILVSLILFIISDKFWNFALRHYSSASS